ncbi:MAG TPA: ABC transporter ATP-binding protein [Usitatibacter sp.]|nr:ABC transporter ATP-binding protein [Usitatibacter sp.]
MEAAARVSEALLAVSGITKRFGGFTALDGVDLSIAPGERLGLIGPNGSGKSTLVSCIAGTLRSEAGSIRLLGRDISREPAFKRVHLGIARSFQIPRPFASMTVADNLRIPLLYSNRGQTPFPARRNAGSDPAFEILEMVGLAAKANAMSGSLTQVDMRKLELARAIAANPRLLIADESMAGLSASEVDEILALLLAMKGRGVAVIMIEHVMRAVMRFSERIAVLVAGRKIADGEPKAVVAMPDVVAAYLGE